MIKKQKLPSKPPQRKPLQWDKILVVLTSLATLGILAWTAHSNLKIREANENVVKLEKQMWEVQKQAERAYISITKTAMVEIESIDKHPLKDPVILFESSVEKVLGCQITYQNISKHPAANIFYFTAFIEKDVEDPKLWIVGDWDTNELPWAQTRMRYAQVIPKAISPSYYIIIGFDYEDPIINQTFSKRGYYSWGGFKNENSPLNFFHMRSKELAKVSSQIEKIESLVKERQGTRYNLGPLTSSTLFSTGDNQ